MSDTEQKFFEELIELMLKEDKLNFKKLNNLKTSLSKKYNLKKIIKNTEIISNASNENRAKIISLLNIKPVRELSGVTVVALFAKPHNCPHGRCIYCPGGMGSEFGDTPQSYTGSEPAALRAIRNKYDPYLQVFNRLEHYVINGHNPDKIELIFMGGTFPSLDKEYRDEFVNFTYKAINDFGEEFLFYDENNKRQINYDKFNDFFEVESAIDSKIRETKIFERIEKIKLSGIKDYNSDTVKIKDSSVSFSKMKPFEKEITKNETAIIRSIGLTIETKPDWALEEHCNNMLEYGCTRFEVGVQTLDDDILKKVNRGHGIAETIKSFQIMKDMCFKINAHMMIGLPGASVRSDEESLRDLFADSKFRPDMLKIYPCLVVRGTPLFKMFESGLYKPVDTKEAAVIIAKAFADFPRYVRVMRVQRDIPTPQIIGGVQNSNLRQYVDEVMRKENIVSKDIRAREIGLRETIGYKAGEFKINIEEYESSGGTDYFIDSVDENDSMIGFIRLRFPSKFGFRDEIVEGTALIRELHVYGTTTAVGGEGDNSSHSENSFGFLPKSRHQHKGWGRRLLEKSEEIARENGYKKMAIISGVGVREYYRKFGYVLEGVYMVKNL
ncbi:MAG: tRNA uridine(34) 5-carboxymethylaminomethyl modification radical SAM/GNAT enzyme Elp3 [Candidatus Woesearchaeota archaeon]|jgi:elongator complex protein 3|nr:tRNA uridine(34) 5-carboxymethylaminomethyl modification radical SAM/GNAT enzyme Elp3 [Candidatus Woesearchaeota archaeon]